jgi:small redox-active disulfide protein 2
MKIQILGAGCPKCQKLAENARKALGELGIVADVEKVTDSDAILDMGVMMTPALAVDGSVKSAGRVLNKDQIADILRGAKQET